ncbi:MAG TPA: TlpA disulfide reductase family protein [Cytophagaceae bacterium]|nr:TlpA disulfide reductase family protein [Cytophagaceae bacterium]
MRFIHLVNFLLLLVLLTNCNGNQGNSQATDTPVVMVSQEDGVGLKIGQQAPDISLPDTSGNVKTLSSLRGNYVLVDFWASWCGPCRYENPNVVRLYQKYHAKGFEVFSVSLDQNKKSWMRAIEADGMEWTHVSDLKKWESAVAPVYNINSIPMTFLLDKKGVIIAKDLRGADLEKKLASILEAN